MKNVTLTGFIISSNRKYTQRLPKGKSLTSYSVEPSHGKLLFLEDV